MSRTYDLAELDRLDRHCRDVAARLGFDVPEVVFHFASAERIYDIAARGLPGRYSHWRFGRAYEQMKLSHDVGQSRIYELVLNTEPYQAYLLEGNAWEAQLLVIAHVYGHCWYFENNRYFERADRKFLHRVRAAAERIEDHARRYGRVEVDDFIDACTALSVHAPSEGRGATPAEPAPPPAPPADRYGDLFADEAAAQRAAHQSEVQNWRDRFPRQPEEDLLGFMLGHANRLEDWQRDVISIVREEASYFLPQRRTKIANEGFASWLHNQIVQDYQLDTGEFIEFDRLHASVTQPHPLQVNPYNLGIELWSEVVRIYTDPTEEERERFPGAGEIEPMERLRELVATCDDASLIATHLTPEVCERCHLYAWKRDNPNTHNLRVTAREAEEIRKVMARQQINLGTPRLLITDADALGRGGLWLEHRHDGTGLDRTYAAATLPYVARLWGREAFLETIDTEGNPLYFACRPRESVARTLKERPIAA